MDPPNDETDSELEKIRRAKLKNMMTKASQPTKAEGSKSVSDGQVISLDSMNFWAILKENERVVIDCYADWCMPCKQLTPIFVQLAQTHRNIIFGRINVDHSPDIASQFQIRAIPLILFFKQGNLVNKLTGLRPYETIEALIQRYLA